VVVQRARILEVRSKSGRVEGVQTETGFLPARTVVVACGVGSAMIRGLDPAIPVVPRKGQILSLDTAGQSILNKPVRWELAYAVPRPNGELVVGATDEDAGFDRSITPAGVGRLLAAAQQLSPKIGNFAIKEMWSGFRPAAPDGLPIIGLSKIEGLFYATGHYRNGILLAPATAHAISALVSRRPSPQLASFSPDRF
jgi:glycine/D-amino acid oxidase-like deaminating enzyme